MAVPVVSVVVPVRNGEQHLTTCLHDIVAQTLRDIEVIVVDDASTDATPAIIDGFAAADSRVRRLSGADSGGAGAARNAGLAAASGRYLAFLDSDDRFSPTLLEELSAKAAADDADIVATRFRVADERTGQIVPVEWGLRLSHFPNKTPFGPGALGDWLFLAVSPAPWNKLFNADFVARADLRFQELRRTNDLFFSTAAMAMARRISYVETYGVDYRVGHESLQGTLDKSPLDFAEALRAIRQRLVALNEWPRLERAFVNLAVEVSLTALRKAGTVGGFEIVHQALRDGLLDEFGVTGRSPEYFLRRSYSDEVAAIGQASSADLVFGRMQRAEAHAAAARAEARTAVRSLIALPAATASVEAHATTSPVQALPVTGPEPGVPDVSVIVPVHNTQFYLSDCLASIQRQPGLLLEIICVDDGSTDASGALLSGIARLDKRVKVLTLPHAGQSIARNAALDVARGRYVCFVDSDDFWRMDALADLVARADAEQLDVLGFDAESVRGAGVSERRWSRMANYYQRPGDYQQVASGPGQTARMKAREHYRASACLYLTRRALLERAHVRFQPGISYEDNLFTFRLMLAAQRTAHLPLQFYARRLRPDSIMGQASRSIAARGYFVCAVEMFRLLHGRKFEPEVATQLGAVVHRVLQQATDQAVRLDHELVAELGQVDQAADAQILHRLLLEAQAATMRRPTKRRPSPSAPTGWSGLARRLRRRIGDLVRGLSRRRRR